MNRYLRMGTRRSSVPRPNKPEGLDDGHTPLAREDSEAIDSVYDEIERELDVGTKILDEEDEDAAAPHAPALSRAWSGERGAYVAVRSPKACTGRG